MKEYDLYKKTKEFCQSNGNWVSFTSPGKIPERKVLGVDVSEKLSNESIKFMEKALNLFQNFNSSPIFIDSFGDDISSRREWEIKLDFLDREVRIYYRSNRIWQSNITKVLDYINVLVEIYPESRKEVVALVKDLNLPWAGRIDEFSEYNFLSDRDKIIAVKNLSVIVGRIIKMIS